MNATAIRKACLLLLLCCGAFFHNLLAQNRITVNGTVKDKLDKPIAGVSVTVQGSPQKGTATNDQGNFSLEVMPKDVLVFSSVGYQPVTRPINNSLSFEVVMEAAEGSQQEVVVVGFGRQRKISVVGAQSSVNVEELKQPVANLSAAIAGRIPGIVGVQRSGLPGSNTADVWIRGIATIGNNPSSPLVVVDGVIGRDINAFDPEDIASFSILKDAAATAVYGVQGANGVILITTKRGRSGKPTLMFNYNQGITGFTKLPALVDGPAYMRLRNEAQLASGLIPEYSQAAVDTTALGTQPYKYPNVNWMKTLFNDVSQTRRANFSARGGSDNANYYVSLAYFDEQSLLKTDGLNNYNADTRFRRYNFTSNVNMNWTKTTKFDLGIQGYITNTNYPRILPQDAFNAVMQTSPILYPVMYPGNLVPAINSTSLDNLPNPWALVTQRGYQNIASNQVYTNARITQELGAVTQGLSVYGMYSFDAFNSQTQVRNRQRNTYRLDFSNPYKPDGSPNLITVYGQGTELLDFANTFTGNRSNYVEAAFNYDRSFGSHHFTGLLLYNQRSINNTSDNTLQGSLPFRSQGSVGRVTYSWKDKYFVEGSFGYNGSENFAPVNRYGFFPAVGLGWVVSNEKFFDKISPVLQYLKFRYSDGIVGAGSGGRRFGYLTLVSNAASGYTYGLTGGSTGLPTAGVSVTDYGTDVRWSTSRKKDLGVEMKFLQSKAYLIVDFFEENRTGIFLQNNNLPNYLGLNSKPFGNIGIVNNKGVDASLDVNNLNLGKTVWSLGGTLTYNRDKVMENGQPKQLYPYLEGRGVNLLSVFGYTALGLFQTQKEIDNAADQSFVGTPRPGDIRYKDLNADGKIDQNDISRIGNGDVPNLVYGFRFNVNWKNWYFGAFFQGISGADRQLRGDGIIPFNNSSGAERSNLFAVAQDRWTVDNPNANAFYPRLGYGNVANRNNAVVSSFWQKDIDFLRFKTVDFGYNLSKSLANRLSMKTARIYVQGLNLFYWSKFTLWDPELNTGNGSVYPLTRNLTFGIQANF